MTYALSSGRVDGLEEIEVEAVAGIDGQGAPLYDSPILAHARVTRQESTVRGASGEEVQTSVTMWIDGGEAILPEVDARITRANGWMGIVVVRQDGTSLGGTVEYVRLQLREA